MKERKMCLKIAYLLFLLCLIESPTGASVLGPDPISVGEMKSLYLIPPNTEGQIFQLNLTQKIPNEDLSVLVFPKTPSSHPILILSKTHLNITDFNESNSGLQETIYTKCIAHGIEICTIPETNLTENASIFITVLCQEKCYFELQINYHLERVFSVGQAVLINFKEKTSQILKMTMPIDNHGFDHLLINARITNPLSVNQAFHVYINQGNSIPSSDSHDYRMETSWGQGMGVSVDRNPMNNNEKPLCFNCNFTLMVEGDTEASIHLTSDLFSNERTLALSREIYDIVNQHQNITYAIKPDNKSLSLLHNEALQFRLKPYSGHPILYINFNTPPKIDHFFYRMTPRNEEEFVLTPLDREKLIPNFTVIYLTVYGETSSAYQLMVSPILDSVRRIDFGVIETGVLAYREVTNYKFQIRDVNTLNLTIDLINEVGLSDIMLRICPVDLSKCDLRVEDYIEKNHHDMILMTENKQSRMNIRFQHQYDKCPTVVAQHQGWFSKVFHWVKDFFFPSTKQKVCNYVLGIVANNSKFNLNRYSLLLNRDKQMNILQEHQTVRSSLDMNNYEDYVFHVFSDRLIQSITFQLTSISGEIIAYSSRNATPTDKSYQERTKFDFDAIHYEKGTGEETMAGSYYLRVYASSSAYYTITTLVDRSLLSKEKENNNSQVNQSNPVDYSGFHPIKLYSGLTQKISYVSNYSYPHYFQVSLNYSQQDLKDIEVFYLSVNPVKGKFMLFVGLGFVPNVDNYTWMSLDNSISIRASDQKFKSQAIYYIMVRNFHNSKDEHYEFLITFSSNSTIVELRLGSPLHTFFMGGDIRHYWFNLDVEKNEDYVISKSVNGIHSDSIRVFISTNQSNSYPDELNANIDMNDSSLVISHGDKARFCQNTSSNKHSPNCKIYLTVKAKENADFALTIKTNESLILLTDGNPVLLAIPSNDHPYKIYFNPPKNTTISISTYSIFKRTAIFASIIPLTEYNPNKESWIFPSNTSYQYSSVNHTSFDSNSLVLHDSYFEEKKCNELPAGCVIALRVYPLNMPNYYSYIVSKPYFSIVASSEIIKLIANMAHIDSVKDKAYKYFTVYANSNDTVFISLVPLSSGDPDLVVSYGEDKRPTLDENEWVVRSFGGENLEITPEGLGKHGKKLPGKYVIGVFGFKTCTFSLTVMVGALKFIKMYNGNPTQLTMREGETVYIDYFHYSKDGFKVVIAEEVGEVEIYVNTKPGETNYMSILPRPGNASTYKWGNTKQIHKNILSILSSDPNFCNLCRYYIAIHSPKPAKATVLISVNNYSISLQSGVTLNDWLLPGETNLYSIFTNTGNLDVILVVYSGDPTVFVTRNYGDNNSLVLKQSEKNRDSKIINLRVFSSETYSGGHIGVSYRITVKSMEGKEANYSIMAVTSFHEKYLKYGALDFSSLKKGETQAYIFSGVFNESIKDRNQSLTISLVFSSENEEISSPSLLKNDFEYFYPNVSFMMLGSESKAPQKAEPMKSHFSGRLINYVIKAENSKFMINVTNQGNDTLNFSVLLNNENFNTILTNSENFGLVPMNRSDNYELVGESNGKFLIEAFECSGKIKLQYTDNYESAANHNFKDSTVNKDDNHLILTHVPGNKYLFFSVSPFEVESESIKKIIDYKKSQNSTFNFNEAYYKLKTLLLPASASSPYERFFYDRKLKWEFSDNYLQVSFDTVRIPDEFIGNKEYEVIEYLYSFYVSDDPEILESVLQCNSPISYQRTDTHPYLSLNYASLYYNETSHPKHASLSLNTSHLLHRFFGKEEFHFKALFFGIQSKILVFGHEKYQTLTFIYEQNQIYVSKTVGFTPGGHTKEGSQRALIIILSVGGALLLLILLILLRRYCIIRKRLEFEVFASKNEEAMDQAHEKNINAGKTYQGFQDEKVQREI